MWHGCQEWPEDSNTRLLSEQGRHRSNREKGEEVKIRREPHAAPKAIIWSLPKWHCWRGQPESELVRLHRCSDNPEERKRGKKPRSLRCAELLLPRHTWVVMGTTQLSDRLCHTAWSPQEGTRFTEVRLVPLVSFSEHITQFCPRVTRALIYKSQCLELGESCSPREKQRCFSWSPLCWR